MEGEHQDLFAHGSVTIRHARKDCEMQTNPLVALTPKEVAACYAVNADYCRDNPDAQDWKQHHDRARMFANMLPDTPLELQVKQYEAEPA